VPGVIERLRLDPCELAGRRRDGPRFGGLRRASVAAADPTHAPPGQPRNLPGGLLARHPSLIVGVASGTPPRHWAWPNQSAIGWHDSWYLDSAGATRLGMSDTPRAHRSGRGPAYLLPATRAAFLIGIDRPVRPAHPGEGARHEIAPPELRRATSPQAGPPPRGARSPGAPLHRDPRRPDKSSCPLARLVMSPFSSCKGGGLERAAGGGVEGVASTSEGSSGLDAQRGRNGGERASLRRRPVAMGWPADALLEFSGRFSSMGGLGCRVSRNRGTLHRVQHACQDGVDQEGMIVRSPEAALKEKGT
jgi:hypothetical protein